MHGCPRILIADDHPLFRDALRHMIGAALRSADISEAHSFAQTLAIATQAAPFDLVFLDLIMPGSPDPLSRLAHLRSIIPDTPILVVSSQDDERTIERVLRLGVAAFVSKSATRTDLEWAIRRVLAGEVFAAVEPPRVREPAEPLSPRQAAVLDLLARGCSNRQIAVDLNIEVITVKAHISAILRKLHVKSRLEAVVVSRAQHEHR